MERIDFVSQCELVLIGPVAGSKEQTENSPRFLANRSAGSAKADVAQISDTNMEINLIILKHIARCALKNSL